MMKLEEVKEFIGKVVEDGYVPKHREQVELGMSIWNIIISGEHTIQEVSEALEISAEELEEILRRNGAALINALN